MSLFQRWTAGPRIKDARKRLADEPSAKNYLALALEHARLGDMDDVRKVCDEALTLHPGHAELQRLFDRARAVQLEARTRKLTKELKDSPRPAVYRDLAQLYFDIGRLERADEIAAEWFNATQDPAAQLMRARARIQRFTQDKRREDGRACIEMLEGVERSMPRDERPLRMHLDLLCALGAWRDARRVVGQLLELFPGDSALEARFRTYNGLADRAPTLEATLREVERTGHFAAQQNAVASGPTSTRSIRPMLQEIAATPTVEAALYERGATALVQGPKGATAERNARAVREIVQKSRTTARRLGLGAPLEVEIEGQFASVFIAPSEHGSAAVWCHQPTVPQALRARVLELVGASVDGPGEEQAS